MSTDEETLRAHEQLFATLSSGAKDVMMQLFVAGPTWDGNVVSKFGRDELIDNNIAFRTNGFASLTLMGVHMASIVNVKRRSDRRWYAKQNQLGRY